MNRGKISKLHDCPFIKQSRKTEFSEISRKSIESNRVILTAENFVFARQTTMFYDFMKSREINILRSAAATMT